MRQGDTRSWVGFHFLAFTLFLFAVGCGGGEPAPTGPSRGAVSFEASPAALSAEPPVTTAPSATAVPEGAPSGVAVAPPSGPPRPCPEAPHRAPMAFAQEVLPRSARVRFSPTGPEEVMGVAMMEREVAPLRAGCRDNCRTECQVLRADGGTLQQLCTSYTQGEAKIYADYLLTGVAHHGAGFARLDPHAFAGPDAFGAMVGAKLLMLGDDDLFVGDQGVTGIYGFAVEASSIRAALPCDQALAIDPGQSGSPLSFGARFGESSGSGSSYPVFHGTPGDREATAHALNDDIAHWLGALKAHGVDANDAACRVVQSTAALVSVTCSAVDVGGSTHSWPLPTPRADDPPSSAGFTYRLRGAQRVRAADLLARKPDAGAFLAKRCFAEEIVKKEAVPVTALATTALEAFGLEASTVVFALVYDVPNDGWPRTLTCRVPYGALGTSLAQLARTPP